MKEIIASFLLGIAAGIGVSRLIMATMLEEFPDTICIYCKWFGRKKNRHRE